MMHGFPVPWTTHVNIIMLIEVNNEVHITRQHFFSGLSGYIDKKHLKNASLTLIDL